jgi:hypothetical protein
MFIIWHFIHIIGISIISIFGLINLIINPTPPYINNILSSINEFLISPVLFVVMGLLYRSQNKLNN